MRAAQHRSGWFWGVSQHPSVPHLPPDAVIGTMYHLCYVLYVLYTTSILGTSYIHTII